MKFRLIIASVLLLSVFASHSASARDKEKSHQKHSIEITTGLPSLIVSLEVPTLSRQMTNYRPYGKQIQNCHAPGLNVGYSYSWSKRWEVNAMINAHLTTYDVVQYPELPGMESAEASVDNYDWSADPVSSSKTVDFNGAVCASVRFKWLVRESFSLYSALGAGIAFSAPIPLPYIAPVGIHFGKGRLYGIAELNVSAANTYGMAGLGIRLN